MENMENMVFPICAACNTRILPVDFIPEMQVRCTCEEPQPSRILFGGIVKLNSTTAESPWHWSISSSTTANWSYKIVNWTCKIVWGQPPAQPEPTKVPDAFLDAFSDDDLMI